MIAEITKGMRLVPCPEELDVMVLELKKNLYENKHRNWVSLNSWRWIVEMSTLVLDVLHALFYNWIMGGELFPYGIRVFNYFQNCYTEICDDVSPFTYTFPPTAICAKYNFGSSGGMEHLPPYPYGQYPCVLPFNELYSWVRKYYILHFILCFYKISVLDIFDSLGLAMLSYNHEWVEPDYRFIVSCNPIPIPST